VVGTLGQLLGVLVVRAETQPPLWVAHEWEEATMCPTSQPLL
jgi:hypothetical protein